MKYGLSPSTIEEVCRVFARHPEVEKAVLYGSRAMGNYKPGSDIDLTLYGAGLNGDVLAKIASDLDDLLLPYSFDLSRFETLDNPELRDHIERIGVDFYTSLRPDPG